MPNDINSLSPDIRDVILNRNLRLPEYIEGYNYDNYASGVNGQGIGEPADVGNVLAVKELVDATNIGVYYRTLQTVGNQYQPLENEEVNIIVNTSSSSSDGEYGISNSTDFGNENNELSNGYRFDNLRANFYSIENLQRVSINQNPLVRTRRVGSYLDEYGNINLGGYSVEPINVLGSLAGGGLLSDGQGGVDTSFDIRSSILGRTLTAVGALDDTPLGVIGGQALASQFFNNVANNAQQEVLGKINDPLSILKGDLFVEEYRITSTNTFLDIGTDLLGFNIPISTLPKDIFFGDNNVLGGNIARANSIIERTGSGQNKQRNRQLNENRFRAGFTDINSDISSWYVYMTDEGDITTLEERILDSFSPNNVLLPIAENFGVNGGLGSSPKTFDNIKENFDNLYRTNSNSDGYGLSWDEPNDEGRLDTDALLQSNSIGLAPNPNSLLLKTKALFDTGFIKTLDAKKFKLDSISEVQTAGFKEGSTLFISKGSAVRNPDTGEFCRVWTKKDGYDTVSDLQKNSGLLNRYENSSPALSVLQDNGFVKISPQIGDKKEDIKKYMFSIENLAWSGSNLLKSLPDCEVGPGDPVTKTNGRIMWFPPYELSFNDNTSVKWESHDFIGRGEPVYTYTNSERSGNLSFKMIVDTPDNVNALAKTSLNDEVRQQLVAMFSGCIDDIPLNIQQMMSEDEKRAKMVSDAKKPTTKNADIIAPLGPFKAYFLNNVGDYESTYEDGDGTPFAGYGDDNDFGLNVEFNNALTDSIKKYVKDNKNIVIEIEGGASKKGSDARNKELGNLRADSIESIIKGLGGNVTKIITKGVSDTKANAPDNANINSKTAKEDRVATFKLKVDQTIDSSLNTPNKPSNDENAQILADRVLKRTYTECDYFNKLAQEDNFVDGVGQLYKKIKYFHPSFHSTTPEGFNSRLNFLLQCTKQGETVRRDKDGNPTTSGQTSNLVFGKPPVCILRIGDFYNTKIIIESVNFTFDPLVWDLNPEGIGVQPMIVNVDIAFKFIGGSSLAGPINKLQNAISFNFFANTELYDERADRIDINGTLLSGSDEAYKSLKAEKEAKNKTNASQDDGLGGNKEIDKDQIAENEEFLDGEDEEETIEDILTVTNLKYEDSSLTAIYEFLVSETQEIRLNVVNTDNSINIDLGNTEFEVSDPISFQTQANNYPLGVSLAPGKYLLKGEGSNGVNINSSFEVESVDEYFNVDNITYDSGVITVKYGFRFFDDEEVRLKLIDNMGEVVSDLGVVSFDFFDNSETSVHPIALTSGIYFLRSSQTSNGLTISKSFTVI